MSDQQILEKAISKAIDGGWKKDGLAGWPKIEAIKVIKSRADSRPHIRVGSNVVVDYETLIFSHDFAKALWGDTLKHIQGSFYPYSTFNGEVTEYDVQIEELWDIPNWQYHLQQMVIAEDPIKYLGENL